METSTPDPSERNWWQRIWVWWPSIRRRLDISGLTLLTVTVMTVGIFSITRQPLPVCLFLLLPICLLAWVRGVWAGFLAGLTCAFLTTPLIADGAWLLSPAMQFETWVGFSTFFTLIGVLIGWQGLVTRRAQAQLVADMTAKLERAQASAERYEALLEELSEGQERLQRMNDELSLLNAIATAVNGSLDVSQVQATAMAHLRALLDIDEMQIYWLNAANDHYTLQAEYPASGRDLSALPPIRAGEGAFGRVTQTKRALMLTEGAQTLAQAPASMQHAQNSALIAPVASRERLHGLLVLGRKNGAVFTDDDGRFLEGVGRILAIAIENAKRFKQTQELSLSDELTGLGNRRMFNMRLAPEVNRALATGAPLCLAMFDLDHFKQVNDQYGHPVGDAVLRQFAQVVQEDIRANDLFCRYGGEEFILLVPDTSLPVALAIAERICRRIGSTPFPVENRSLPITISAGVACLEPDHATAEGLVAAADKALYMAKATGRNRVEVYATHPETTPSPAVTL